MLAYKGFNKDMTCRDMQFAVGETYKHDGKVAVCESGFHVCEYPPDCFNYYPPGESVYAIVDADGDIDKHEEDSKLACSSLTIKASIDLPGLIKAAIEYTTSRYNPAKAEHATGYSSASSATGDSSASSATGDRSASSATGYRSASSATGDSSASITTGHYSSTEVTKPDSQSVAVGVGYANKAKAATGCAIVLVHRNDDGAIIHIRASKVGDSGIKPDVFYTLSADGEFVEAT